MKKLLSLALTLAMFTCLAACGGDEPAAGSRPVSVGASSQPASGGHKILKAGIPCLGTVPRSEPTRPAPGSRS